MNWKLIYRLLVDLRRGLNRLIDFARARAYPNMARKKPTRIDTGNPTVTFPLLKERAK